jgi:hypothetical protein
MPDQPIDLLASRHNVFSQNGEDGILEKIFSLIGEGSRNSCEFGAWDGIHFSNCRHLILQGWQCIMIEGEGERYEQLCTTYAGNDRVVPVHCFVDTASNSVDAILQRIGSSRLDLLSIDIDGLDFEIMASLKVRPRVICVEVNAGHAPERNDLLPRDVAAANVGQSLGAFSDLAQRMGYGLVCYNGNAFFMRADCMESIGWRSLNPVEAYDRFLDAASTREREWLLLVNEGRVPPYHRYENRRLEAASLGVRHQRALALKARASLYRGAHCMKQFVGLRRK